MTQEPALRFRPNRAGHYAPVFGPVIAALLRVFKGVVMTAVTLEALMGETYQQQECWAAAMIGQQAYFSDTIFQDRSPIDGQTVAQVGIADLHFLEEAVQATQQAFRIWRMVPAPKRGMLVAEIGRQVHQVKEDLAALITLEVGKTRQEALGEVQEWIDMCDFAVGLSRQLYGLTVASERPGHRLMEQWHPLGPVGVISAFNFPVAVWAWNAMLAFVCGDSVVWKPSEKAPLCALACHAIVQKALQTMVTKAGTDAIAGVFGLHSVVIGQRTIGEAISQHSAFPLVSATGSVAMGKAVNTVVAARLGRCLLELGGNNAAIITPSASLAQSLTAVVFAALGTAGQRCTTLRRLIVHHSVKDRWVQALIQAYRGVAIGDPRDESNLVGPLIDDQAYESMQIALHRAVEQGGNILVGGQRVSENVPSGVYVVPALVEMPAQTEVVCLETFAPILYILTYEELDEAISLQNAVTQGLSSAIFTESMVEAEMFLSAVGSDCGIANVNIGTSGAEIGGAFGGEKDTGGGREAGSDAWKYYMRRATNTIHYGEGLTLAQGIEFNLNEQ